MGCGRPWPQVRVTSIWVGGNHSGQLPSEISMMGCTETVAELYTRAGLPPTEVPGLRSKSSGWRTAARWSYVGVCETSPFCQRDKEQVTKCSRPLRGRETSTGYPGN